MQKNWYMLYIRERAEKRVSAALKKINIQNFCPINCRKIKQHRRFMLCYEPLFGPYVFANLDERDFSLIKRIKNIVNVVYRMNKPAIITNEEIEAIKEFTQLHHQITIEKYRADNNDAIKVIGIPLYSIDRNIVVVKANPIKVQLPSLGLVMAVDIERSNIIEKKNVSLKEVHRIKSYFFNQKRFSIKNLYLFQRSAKRQ